MNTQVLFSKQVLRNYKVLWVGFKITQRFVNCFMETKVNNIIACFSQHINREKYLFVHLQAVTSCCANNANSFKKLYLLIYQLITLIIHISKIRQICWQRFHVFCRWTSVTYIIQELTWLPFLVTLLRENYHIS